MRVSAFKCVCVCALESIALKCVIVPVCMCMCVCVLVCLRVTGRPSAMLFQNDIDSSHRAYLCSMCASIYDCVDLSNVYIRICVCVMSCE